VRRFGYPGLKRSEKAVVLRFLERVSGYTRQQVARLVSRIQEKKAKQLHLAKKAQHWIVEVSPSWFNRFRKLLVRYEKLERSFLALNHLAAGVIALRKVQLKINIT